MGIAIANVPVEWTPGRALMLVILIISASAIRVALNLATAATGFWFRNPWSMVSMFVHQLGELAKYPITIYSLAVQALIVVAVPFAFVSFFPTAYIFEVDAFSPIGLLTPLVALYCVVMAVIIFRVGLRRYESAARLRPAWGCSSAGRAPRSHRGGQGFESPHLHHSLRFHLAAAFAQARLRSRKNATPWTARGPGYGKLRARLPARSLIRAVSGESEIPALVRSPVASRSPRGPSSPTSDGLSQSPRR
jgi:hypothetical protein